MPDTSRLSIPYPQGSDPADVPSDMQALAQSLDSAVVYGQGTLANRPISTSGTPGIPGRLYRATNTGQVFWDTGTSWVEITLADGSVSNAKLGAAAVATANVQDSAITSAKIADGTIDTADLKDKTPAKPTSENTLPASPADGQEIYYVADSSNGVIWHLRYRAASAFSSYKWEFCGGTNLYRADVTQVQSTSNTGVDTGASISVPLKGIYRVSWGHHTGSANFSDSLVLTLGSTTSNSSSPDAPPARFAFNGGSGNLTSGSNAYGQTSVSSEGNILVDSLTASRWPAGRILNPRFFAQNNGYSSNSWVSAVPVVVGP